MLRKLRLTLAVLFFVAVTALFLDFTGTVHAWLGWTAKIQFLPALLALNVGVIVALVLLTLLLGRVYCSVICPLGVMQDIVSWISGRRKTKRYRFSYSPEIKWLRYGVLGLFVIALIAGIGSFVALLAPYSSYGRIASNLFAPLYRWGNNLLAYFAERADSYAFYETEVWMKRWLCRHSCRPRSGRRCGRRCPLRRPRPRRWRASGRRWFRPRCGSSPFRLRRRAPLAFRRGAFRAAWCRPDCTPPGTATQR